MNLDAAESPRTASYAKDPALERALAEANAWLAAHSPAPDRARTEAPVSFVVGLQRSGSTLMMQLLAAAFALAWPDNIVARLWRAPALGMLVSRSLRQQCRPVPRFESDYGVTNTPFEPHEFGYFWQHWLPFATDHEPSPEALAAVDWAALEATLAGMEQAAAAPLLFKGVALALVLPTLATQLPTSRYIWVRRPLIDVAVSTYRGRVERHGSAAHWWSLRPATHATMALASPIEQVAMQVAYCEARVCAALSALPPARVCAIDFADLVARPGAVLARLSGFLGQAAAPVDLTALAQGRRDSDVPRPDPGIDGAGAARAQRATDTALRRELASALARHGARGQEA